MSEARQPSLADSLAASIALDEQGLGNIWPVFGDSALFSRVIQALAVPLRGTVDKVAGIESRGFVLGAAVAGHLGVGFVAIRKSDGLYPGETFSARTSADYRGREHVFRLQRAAVHAGERIALVDDWFETGSQGLIGRRLLEEAGAVYVGASIIIDQLSDERRSELAPCHALLASTALDRPAA
ncbi:MAG TPA: phosphoribosyltransferase family protein [Solirubrobacteraceae bacterium]|nr:phosphoribosyltransferase family protein [Solirubrobacteraceae bacterium]